MRQTYSAFTLSGEENCALSENGNTTAVISEKSSSEIFLEMQHVSVARGENVVLHDISLRIASGEHVAILGPNGCGKSTLIKTIICQVYPMVTPEMRLQLLGRERWDVSQLRQHLGLVSADLPGERTPVTRGVDAVVAGFFSASTLWPNLVVTPEMRERAHEALQLMEATHLENKLVGEMSAGEQRRIMIARALVHRPEMLLLDEPSNALDIAAQRELRDALRNVAQQGTGILMVTHHLADILPEIDRVIMMRQGRIFADGPRRELIAAEKLGELFGVEVTLMERDGYWHSC
jgi:iron complex transport system ATP-binding protein